MYGMAVLKLLKKKAGEGNENNYLQRGFILNDGIFLYSEEWKKQRKDY